MGAIMACGALRTLNEMWREGIQKSKKRARGKAELTHSTATGQETDGFSLLLRTRFLKKKKKKSWVPAFLISFFTQKGPVLALLLVWEKDWPGNCAACLP